MKRGAARRQNSWAGEPPRLLRAPPGIRQLGIDFSPPAGHAVPELARPDFEGMVPYRLAGDVDDVESDDRIVGGHVEIDNAGVVAPGKRLAQAHLGHLDRIRHARALGEPGADHFEEVVSAFFGPGDAVGLRPVDVARHQNDAGNMLVANEVEDLVPFMTKTGPGILAEGLRVVCPAAAGDQDRKSTRLNSSRVASSY